MHSLAKLFIIILLIGVPIFLISISNSSAATAGFNCGVNPVAGTSYFGDLSYPVKTNSLPDGTVTWDAGFGPSKVVCIIESTKPIYQVSDSANAPKIITTPSTTVTSPWESLLPVFDAEEDISNDIEQNINDLFKNFIYVIGSAKQDVFKGGDTLFFNYTIHNQTNTNATVSYLPYINCESAPNAFMVDEGIEIVAGKSFSGSFYGIIVDRLTDAQTCIASVVINSAVDQKSGEYVPISQEKFIAELNIDVPDNFNFEVNILKNGARTRTLYLGDQVVINYSSPVRPNIRAFLTDPYNVRTEIQLPFLFTAQELGNYFFEATAYVEGYKPSYEEFSIGVIATKPVVLGYKTSDSNNLIQTSLNTNISSQSVIKITNVNPWTKLGCYDSNPCPRY